MKIFPGFPHKMKYTPLPDIFFTTLLPDIEDNDELKVTLHIFWVLYRKRGYPRFITYRGLLADRILRNGIGKAEALKRALDQAVNRGTILHLTLEREGKQEELYFLNTESDRRARDRILREDLTLGQAVVQEEPPVDVEKTPDIFALYEQNIGILTPMIAEELQEAEKLYPPLWIKEAFKEAVGLNKRNWRYIARILENWVAEGKDYGEPGRDSTKASDTGKYFKGKYGHLVKH